MIAVSVFQPSDALSQHLPSYLSISYLGPGVQQGAAAASDLGGGVSPLGLAPDLARGVSALRQTLLPLGGGYLLSAAAPDFGPGVGPLGRP